MTTTSFSSSSACSAPRARSQSASLRSRQGARLSASSTSPSTTTCEAVSFSGLSSTGFMRTSGRARAARAWKYCAAPISPCRPPRPGTTRALLLMFCALYGATRSPWRAYQRHSAVVRKLLPAPLVVPSTMTARPRPAVARGRSLSSPLIAWSPPARSCRTRHAPTAPRAAPDARRRSASPPSARRRLPAPAPTPAPGPAGRRSWRRGA